MKIHYLATLGILAICLGCGSGESDGQSSNGEVKILIGTPGGEKSTEGGTGKNSRDTKDTKKGTELTEERGAASVDMVGMTPEKVLDKMVAAYKNAKSYTDLGQIRLSGDLPGPSGFQPVSLVAPMSMSLEKPNKVMINANKGTAICDGKTLYEYVEPLPNQVLQKPAPEIITIESVFTEPILADAMAQGPTQYYTWIPIQAVLLLADNPLKTLLYRVERTELLKPELIEDRVCYQVAIHRHDGKAVFWIDAESFVLRRFEYPLGGIERDFQSGRAKSLKVVADFRAAALNTKVNERTFLFQPPKKTQIVNTLAPLQIHMLGRPAPDFFFDMVDGKPVTLKSLAGKTVVINFWASWSRQCRTSLGMMNKIAKDKSFKDNDKVLFLACSIDRKTVTDEELKKMLGEMKISLPICRDTQDFAHREFHIPGVPVTIIIGPKGIIQDYQSRHHMLLRTVQAVTKGANIYDRQLAMFESLRIEYGKIIQRMLTEDLFIDPESISQMMPIPGVASQSTPKRARLIQLWFCKDVGVPGNIMVQNDSEPPRIFVCHDSHSIVELDTQGKIIKDYRFAIPSVDAAITNIRQGKTASGERFYVGFAPGFQQFFFLDERFNIRWSFPKSLEQGAPSGIADVQIGDLTGDGTPEIYVGYRGGSGVKAVSLQGKVLWSSRGASGVTKMAIAPKSLATPENRATPTLLLCTTDKYSLVGFNGEGTVVKKFDLGNRRFYWIAAAQLDTTSQPGTSGKTSLCGLSAPDIGRNEAFGINLGGDLLWAYQLPDGASGSIINRITTGRLFPLPTAQWVLLAADSSIHIISASGRPIDSFNYGSFVAGIATVKLGDRQVLLISSLNGVKAITLQPHE